MQEYKHKFNPCFDDILLVPGWGNVESRSKVDLTMDIGRRRPTIMTTPIISSPMDTVTDGNMARAMALEGGLGIIHRYNTIDERSEQVRIASKDGLAVGAAVGA